MDDVNQDRIAQNDLGFYQKKLQRQKFYHRSVTLTCVKFFADAINPLPNDKILTLSNLKAFADANFSADQMVELNSDTVEL